MSVTALTALLLIFAVTAVAVGVLRGRRRSAPEAFIRLGVMLACIMLAVLLAPALAQTVLPGVVKKLVGLIKLKGTYTAYPHFGELVRSVAFGLTSPVVFLLLFLPLWGIGSGIVSICIRSRRGRGKRRERAYANADKRCEDKQEAWCGALAGGLVGLALCVCVTAPIIGTLRLTVDANTKLTELPGVKSGLLKPAVGRELTSYAYDPVGNALYVCGGQLIYEGTARSEINGDGYGLVRELDRATDILVRAEVLVPQVMATHGQSMDAYRQMHALVDALETSPAARTLMADYIVTEAPALADKYAENAKSGNGIAVSLVDVMMQKCARTTYDTVCPDMHSFINVLEILGKHDLNNLSYEEAVALLSESGIMDSIYTVMLDAPSLLSAVDSLNGLASSAFLNAARELQRTNPDMYNAFVDDLVGTFRQTEHYSDERRLNTIRNCVSDYADMMKLNASDEIREAASQRIMAEFASRDSLTREDITSLFEQAMREGQID